MTFSPHGSFFLESEWSSSPDLNLFTDASSLGYGEFWNGAWLMGTWDLHQLDYPIAWKEIAAIMIACLTWGHCWQGKRILFQVDNQAVVSSWQKSGSRSPALMSLLQTLFLFATKRELCCRLEPYSWNKQLCR